MIRSLVIKSLVMRVCGDSLPQTCQPVPVSSSIILISRSPTSVVAAQGEMGDGRGGLHVGWGGEGVTS